MPYLSSPFLPITGPRRAVSALTARARWAVLLLLLAAPLLAPFYAQAQAPTISNYSPGSGSAGTLVTITGNNLDRVRGVRFGGGALALFTAQSATSLTVKVPVDAASGTIRLTPVTGNAVSSTGSFSYLVRPRGLATSLSPAGPLDVCQARTLTASAATPAFAMNYRGIWGTVQSMVLQPDGKLLVGGSTSTNGGTTQDRISRINVDGTVDATFSVGSGFNSTVNSIALQADGKVLVGGNFSTFNGAGASRLIRLNADGSIDGTFNMGSGIVATNRNNFPSYVQTVVVQPDGKILVGGLFTSYNGQARGGAMRLNANGSLDATFNPQTTDIFSVFAIALQDDGKVLLGGNFTAFNGDLNKGRFVRVNADGTLDTTFPASGANFYIYSNGVNNNGAYVNSIAVQADGKILAGGYFSSYNGAARDNLARILPTGAIDPTFAPSYLPIVVMVALQRDGHVLVGRSGGTAESGLVRLNSDGSGASTNNYSATRAGTNGAVVYAVAEQPDGKLLIGGRFDSYSNVATNGTPTYNENLVRVNADFSLNNAPTPIYGAAYTFSPNNTTTNPLTTTTTGNYSAVASLDGETSSASNTVTLTACPTARLLDCPFPCSPGVSPTSGPAGTSVTIQGNLLLPTQSVRFGTGGVGIITGYEQYGNSVTVEVPVDAASGPLTLTLSNGQVLTSYTTFTYLPKPTGLTATVTPAGPLDLCAPRTLTATASTPAFATGTGYNAAVNDVTLTLANKVLVAGDFTSFNGTTGHQGIMQLNVDGTRDANFATSGAITLGVGGSVQAVALYPNNTILVAGNFTTSTGPRNLIRLYADGWVGPGTAYAAFNRPGPAGAYGTGFNALARSLAVQADNKIVVGGDFTSYNGSSSSGVARVNADGSYDASFVVGSGASSFVYTVALQADGKVLVGGAFTTFNGVTANGIVRLNPNGSRDATFTGTGVNAGGSTGVYSIGVQPDGKVLLGGNFTSYNGVTRNRIVRLNADGTVDATFVAGTGFDGNVQSILVQPDGKLVLGGSFTTYKGVAAVRVIRLNADGSVDTGFVPGAGANGAVTTLALQPNGLIMAGGSFTSYNGNTGQNRLVRLSTDGTQNTTPTPISGVAFSMSNANGSNPYYPPRANTYQARATLNGVTTNSNIVTVTACVAPTITSFTPTSGETGTVVTLTGTTLGDVTGVSVNNTVAPFNILSATSLTFTVAAGTTTGVVRVTNAAGTTTGGTFTVSNPTVGGITPTSGPAGTLVVITGTNLDRVRGVRFGTGGLGLFTAQSATSLTVRVLVDAATGALTLTSVNGNTTSSPTFTYAPRPAGLLASLSPLGSQDVCQPRSLTGSAVSPAFSTSAGFGGEVTGLAVQADGRVLAGGNFTTYNGANGQNRLVRLLPDGTLDASFGVGTGFTGAVSSVAVQADGKVLVGGNFTAYNGTTGLNRLVRLNANGTLDAGFTTGTGFDATVQSIVVQADGKVLVVGDFSAYRGVMARRLIRLNTDGSSDAGFVTGTGFNGVSPRVALQADGKLLVGGNFTTYNGAAQKGLIRLNPDGTPDASFAIGTGFTGAVNSVAVQADGKVLVGGDFTAYNGSTGLGRLLRLTANGSLDATLVTGTGFNGIVRSLTIQADGKVLAGGDFTAYNGTTGLGRLLRLTSTGNLDATFATGIGFDNAVYAAVLQADGKVLAGGFFTSYNGTTGQNRLVRLTATGALDNTTTPVSGATFTFTPGNSTANPLVTSTAGSYSAVASLNGETSIASNSITLTACPAPTITSFTPTSGSTGTVVNITGTNLLYASAVKVNGVNMPTYTVNSATSISFTLAAGATTGAVTATTAGGTATGGTFTVDPAAIISISPSSGGTGTVVTITGTNLLGATAVSVNGVNMPTFTVNSATSISFTLSSSATTGPVRVTMPGGGIITGGTFTVDPVTITSFTPTSGGPGTVVTITGTNLLGTSVVRVNGVLMGSTTTPNNVISATTVTFTVAATATTGTLSLTTPTGTVTGGTFTVIPVTVSGFTPASGPAGTLVTITGTSLSGIRGVRFGTGGLAPFVAQSATSLTVRVPTNAATGLLTLTSSLSTVFTSASSFTFTPRPADLVATLSPAGPMDGCAPRTLTASAVSPAFVTGTGMDANSVAAIVEQPDGKLVVGGQFLNYQGVPAGRIIRLNPDGSRDGSFAIGTGFNLAVSALALQADGKVVVVGNFTAYDGTSVNRIARINPDGSLDATFAVGAGFDATVSCLVVMTDGKVVVGGNFTTYDGISANRIIRLNPDGSRDASFAIGIGFPTAVTALALQADGKVLVGGNFTAYNNGGGASRIVRLLDNGRSDVTFATNTGTGFNGQVNSLTVQSDGKILAGGIFTNYNTVAAQAIARLTANGSRDATFVTGTGFNAGATVNTIVVQPSGNVLVGGLFTSYNGTTGQNRIIRLSALGVRDASFNIGTGFDTNGVRGITVQSDGSILVGGAFILYNGATVGHLIRLNTDGSPNNAPTPVSGATFTFSPGNTTINPLVTSTAGSYSAVASLNGATSAPSNTVTITACPATITGFTPAAGPVGTMVTVTGTYLSTATAVSVNGTAGTLTGTPTATSLTFTVGAGSTTGPVSVTTAGGTATSTGSFTVITNQAPTALVLSNTTVAENTGADAVVGSLTTTDPDAGNTFTYTLVSGGGSTDNGLVNISGTQLRITTSPDYEAQASYAIRVRATDQDGLSTEQPFTISVTDVNEAATSLTLSNRTIAENVGPNALVGTFSNNDPDAGDTFRYLLVNGPGAADGGYFTIVGNELHLNTPADFETKATYEIAVFVGDQNNQGRAEQFVISVTDVLETPANDAPSDLLLSNADVAENTANAPVGLLTTADGDVADQHTYTLVSGAGSTGNAAFQIVGDELRVGATALDFEAQPSYSIRIRTTDDGAGNLFFEKAFTISVTDMAEPLTVSTATNVPAGLYSTLTVTGTGTATLTGAVRVTDTVLVHNGGRLNTNCQPLTGEGSFTLEAGATLGICDAAGISLHGPTGAVQVTGDRVFASDAKYIYNGTQTQVTGNGLPATVRELETANAAGVDLSQGVAVTTVLHLTSGTLTTSGLLALLSTATRTAYAVHSGGLTSGNVTVQRYVGGPTAGGYRHLSSPVQATTVADLTTAGYAPLVNPAYNNLPYVALPAASFPNVFGYDETRGGTTPAYAGFNTGYYSPASTEAALTAGRGWSVFMPGDETPDFVGALTTGDVPQTLTVTGTNTSPNQQKAGWHTLGNPYAQPIDWDLATVPEGMSSSISVFRTQGGNNGQYLTRANGMGSLPNGELPLGQGFFARATSATVFMFTNALRVEANPATVARPVVDTRPTIRLTLASTAPDAVADEAVIYAEAGATTGEDNRFDGLRPGRNTGTVPTLASLIDGQEAAVNGLPLESLTTGQTVVELTAALPTVGTYLLTAAAVANLPANTTVSLLDRKLNITQPLVAGAAYQLTASAAGEVVAGRFALVFNSQRPLGTSNLAPGTSPLLTLFPNPVAGGAEVRVTGIAAGERVQLLDATGRVVQTATTAVLNTRELAAGVYTVRAAGGRTTRLVVE